ncbi:MAG: GNAT family N-acetyltransferase [Candidatus Hodarchaeales archaeon]|jgi:RimJ/RimL family protein N-acetyltransferase
MYEGKLVRLRGFRLEDVKIFLDNWNNYELRRFLDDRLPHSKEEEENWVRRTWEGMRSGKNYAFVMESLRDNEFLGSAGLHAVNPVTHSALLGIAIHEPRNWGHGFGLDAIEILLRIAFDILNLHRVELEVHDFNTRAIACYRKAGFQEVGRKRESRFTEGRYNDSLVMDMLAREWKDRHTSEEANS